MVTKAKKEDSGETSGPQVAASIKESAQQIWLAGLGAFAKAQEEGGKVFETLVKEGTSLQRKSQAAAEERFSDAATRVASMANDISSKASGQWGKLEGIFEERVAKAIKKLGVPSAEDMQLLMQRIDELDRSIAKLAAKPAGRRQPGQRASKPASKRTTARKTP